MIHRIIPYVHIQIGLSTLKQDGVFGRPAAYLRIVVTGSEADQARFGIIDAPGKAKGLEVWIGV